MRNGPHPVESGKTVGPEVRGPGESNPRPRDVRALTRDVIGISATGRNTCTVTAASAHADHH